MRSKIHMNGPACTYLLAFAIMAPASGRQDAPVGGGYCGGSTPVYLPGPPPATLSVGGPLVINPEWDASVLSTISGTYDIQAGVNDRIDFLINGVDLTPILLTAGVARTADEIAADLNANGAFDAVADARGWRLDPEAVLIRSRGAQFGSIEVQNTTNSAHLTLGFTIGVTGPSVTPAQRLVFEQAMTDWEAVIVDGGNIASPYTLRIAYRASEPNGTLATASPTYSGQSLIGGTMNFDSTESWFEDPTPGDDGEFGSGCAPDGCVTCPVSCVDLLTVARHEMGHALGFSGTDGLLDVTTALTASLSDTATTVQVQSTAKFLESGEVTLGTERISYSSKTATTLNGLTRGAFNTSAEMHATGTSMRCDNVYDSQRLNIAVSTRGSHTHGGEHPNGLMNPSIGTNTRRPIMLYPDAARISRAELARIPLAILDPSGSASPDGSANSPYPDVTSAMAASMPGTPLLLTNGAYMEPTLPLLLGDTASESQRTLIPARNAAAVVQ